MALKLNKPYTQVGSVGGLIQAGNVGGAIMPEGMTQYSGNPGDNPDASGGGSLMEARQQDFQNNRISGNNMWLPWLQRLQGTKVAGAGGLAPSVTGVNNAAFNPDMLVNRQGKK